MLKFYYTACLFLLMVSSISYPAYGMSCVRKSMDDSIKDYDIIFLGEATHSEPSNTRKPDGGNFFNRYDTVTQFKIESVFKGDLNNTIEIHHVVQTMVAGGSVKYKIGSKYYIFAKQSNHEQYGQFYVTGACSPRPYTSEDNQTLEDYKSKTEMYKKMLQEVPGDLETLLQQAELHESYNDFSVAKSAYRKGVQKALEQSMSSMNADHEVIITKVTLPFKIGYARVLYKSNEYEKAHDIFQSLTDQDALKEKDQGYEFYVASLIKLKKFDRLSTIPVDVSGMVFKELDLSGANFKKADFSDVKIRKLILKNSQILDSDFTNSQIVGINIDDSQINDNNFQGSTLRFSEISDVEFIKSNFKDAKISIFEMSDVDFSGSDFSNSNVRFHREYKNIKLQNANLSNAYFHCLSGMDLKGTNLNKIQRTSAGEIANYNGVDFSGFDLSGGDFRGAKFQNAKFHETNLQGANLTWSHSLLTDFRGADLSKANLKGARMPFALYDCHTKFPDGFNPDSHYMLPVWDDCKKPNPRINFAELSLPPIDELNSDDKEVKYFDTWGHVPRILRLNLDGANFEGSSITKFTCVECSLKGANFNNVSMVLELRKSDLTGATFKDAKIDARSDLSESDFSGADLSGILFRKSYNGNFYKPRIRNIKYDDQTKWPENFDFSLAK